MTNVELVIDGTTVWDGDTGQWTSTTPLSVSDALQLSRPQAAPYLMCARAALVEAAMTGVGVRIEACTRANGWTVSVTQKGKANQAGPRVKVQSSR